MDPPDRFAQQGGDGDDSNVRQHLLGFQRQTICDDDFDDRRFTQSLCSLTAEDCVSSTNIDAAGSVLMDRFHGTRHRSTGGDHVIKNDARFAADGPADQVFLASLKGIRASLIDNRKAATEMVDMLQRSFDAAFVGTDDDQVFFRQVQ